MLNNEKCILCGKIIDFYISEDLEMPLYCKECEKEYDDDNIFEEIEYNDE